MNDSPILEPLRAMRGDIAHIDMRCSEQRVAGVGITIARLAPTGADHCASLSLHVGRRLEIA